MSFFQAAMLMAAAILAIVSFSNSMAADHAESDFNWDEYHKHNRITSWSLKAAIACLVIAAIGG